jgi:two-component system invasion response regulator UvrY
MQGGAYHPERAEDRCQSGIMINILLVDDHELFRAGMRSILGNHDDLAVVGEADSGEAAVDFVRKNPPHVVMMDVNMPGIGGLEATRKIMRVNPEVKVIAVTVLDDEPYPAQLLEAGAKAYISKGCPANEMFEAIKSAVGGRPYLSNDVAQKLSLAKLAGTDEGPMAKLSGREIQVMMMITQGQSTQAISDALFLSPKTVSTYRHRLYEKLGVSNDVELTHFAIRHGLIDKTQ